jgi:DNA polymerase III alpha subunit (gram-positive type)
MSYAIVDVETVGLSPLSGTCPGILSIACLTIDKELNKIEEKVWKIAVPAATIEVAHPRALEVNGYTPEGWMDAQPLETVLMELAEMMTDRHFVAHNAPFDLAFIRRAFDAADMEFPKIRTILCTMSMMFPLKFTGAVGSASLNASAEWAGVARQDENTHWADEDVYLAWMVLRKLCGLD